MSANSCNMDLTTSKNCRVCVQRGNWSLSRTNQQTLCYNLVCRIENRRNLSLRFWNRKCNKRDLQRLLWYNEFLKLLEYQEDTILTGWCFFPLFSFRVSLFVLIVPQPLHGESLPFFMASSLTRLDALLLCFMKIFERYWITWVFQQTFGPVD